MRSRRSYPLPMSESMKNTRNVVIILAIAAGVFFIPGGGRAASTFEAALLTAFALAIGFLALRQYREHRVALFSLRDRYRGLLYGAVGLAVFLWAVRPRMWYALEVRGAELVQVHRWDGLGETLWFVLAGLVVYSLYAVYRHARRY
jgi:multisubunit Na+/H+ antiporter MnhB subunit